MKPNKKHQIIKILIGFNLVIFLLPFFNACSNKPLKVEHKEKLNEIEQSRSISNEYKAELLKNENERFVDLSRSNDDKVLNGYQLALMPFQDISEDMFKEPFFYFSLCFTFLLLSILIMFILISSGKNLWLRRFVICNILVSILCLILPLLDNMLNYLDQLKIGYFLFLINLSVILLLLNKTVREKQ